ncbi:MAG: cellulase family glycosylhydrolase, partial [Bacteroidaceae bacterium]|nr:cellulase family glycosylhydrolase [Bacteroidaceae bacterium]
MKRILTMLMLAVVCLVANAQFGALPPLHQDGNMFRDTHGNPVVLHGAMDTPSPYFSGWRWGGSCNESTITPCITYFDKLFTHMTDTTNGLWCNLFRLHLDPCWTNNSGITAAGFTKVENDWYDPNGTKVGGEADVHQFDKARLKTYMTSLYSKIAQKALDHGMYVIMRPPGVCPEKIKVGDYYQEYLMTVWDIVSQNSWVKRNAGQLMLELANEPVGLQDANGGSDPRAMHDFFQPIVNKIRENGFTGIILVPGTGYQSNYREYEAYPIEDYNLGYAVHVYPGWYSNSDTQTSAQSFIDNFGKAVPVVKTNHIVGENVCQ